MSSIAPRDDLEHALAAAVSRGEYATYAEARAAFDREMDAAIDEAEAGQSEDAEVVFAELRARYAAWPRAAE